MFMALLKTMRPKQWTKNVVVFAALVFDRKLLHFDLFLQTLVCFGLLCLLSSTVYLVNDLADIEKDQQHPKKRLRPLPSGTLKKEVAIGAAVVLPLLVLPVSFWLNWQLGAIAVLYLGINLLYSFSLKHVVIIDVLIVAAGYLLRVAAGAALAVVEISPWLYVCMTLLALFMGFGKRRGELLALQNATGSTRKVLEEYTLPFLDELINLVSTCTVIAYSLYTFTWHNLPTNHAMMITIPLVLYAIFRYLYLIHVRGEGGAPDELVLTDRPLQVAFVLWGLTAVGILYLFPPNA